MLTKYRRKTIAGILFLILSTLLYGQGKDTTLILYYKTNSFKLDSNQKKSIGLFLSKVIKINNIIGYADTVGSRLYNYNLSKRRADEVADFIKNKMMVTSTPEYKGEDHFMDSDFYKNRKVEITATLLQNKELISERNIQDMAEVSRFTADNIYFLPDRAIITEESLPYVDLLVKRLKSEKPTETFQIIGHVNYQGKGDSSHLHDLYWLSERRAKEVYTLLIEKGIPSSRLFYKGVGNSQPVFLHPANEEEKRKNMRVEVIILK